MDGENGRDDAGNALRGVLIELRHRVRVMIGREIRKECNRQLQIAQASLKMNQPVIPASQRV